MSSVASLSDILPMSFVGHFVVDRLQLKKKKKKKKKESIMMFLCSHLFMDERKRLWKSAVEIASPTREDLKIRPADRCRGYFSSGKSYLLPGALTLLLFLLQNRIYLADV